MMDMNPMWRASFFKRSIDAEPASRLIIAAPAEREAAQIAFNHMMDFERVDLVRTLDKSQTIPMDEYPLLHIQGDLATDRDVQVDGHINGNVSCARLTIGKDGAIAGDIKAKEIVVRGKVKGT